MILSASMLTLERRSPPRRGHFLTGWMPGAADRGTQLNRETR